MASTRPPTTGESRDRLIGKVKVICERVVRGQHAVDAWQIKAHRSLRVASIILSALGGAGLVAVNVNPDLPKETGWPLMGSLISLVFGILLQLSNEFGIDQRAMQARSAAGAFSVIGTNLDIVLGNENPTEMVTKLLEEANALWVKYNEVVPRPSAGFDAEAGQFTVRLVSNYEQQWVLPSARRQRKRGQTPPIPPAAPPNPNPPGHE